MSYAFEPKENSSIEVALIPESKLCGNVGETERAGMAQGCSLFCCMGSRGELIIGDLADTEASGTTLSGPHSDFAWEEVSLNIKPVSCSRLLAVSSQCDLRLLEVKSEGSGPISLTCISECSADRLLQIVRDKDYSVSELVSMRLLSFADGQYCLLINTSLVLQMLWEPETEEVQSLSCCRLQLTEKARNAASHVSLCRGTLFVLTTSGIIYIFDNAEGIQLASMDLPAYLSSGLGEEEPPCPSSFCLFQVSPDLSTGVAATRSQAAVAVDLNHYFRTFPDHLLCGETPSRPTLKPQQTKDQDGVSSSTWSQAALGICLSPDRSWEAWLASMYNKAQASSPSQPAGSPWFSGLPRPESSQALNASRLSRSRVPPGGAIVSFSVPESASPCLLSVSEFSATLTFTCPAKSQTTVALWDFQSQSVSYHRPEDEAVPVQRSGEHQLSLLLKRSGLSQVLFGVSQQDLLSRLMVFGSAATVDALCHLNAWGRCSIPLHSLQAGVKNRQLDTVEFFLKSKESILNVCTGSSPSDQPAVSTLSLLNSIEELCPALDLLCSAIKDSHSEAQGKQFSEQLLSITLNFLNRLLRSLLCGTQELDASLQSCMDILDGYITELRRYMRRFPWPAGDDTSSTGSSASPQDHTQEKAWDFLTTEEVIQEAILTGQIPRAQVYLRGGNRPEQTMEELRRVGLHQAFSCLVNRELLQSSALLRNMGFNVKQQLHSICLYTHDKDLRDFVVEELSRQSYFSEEEMQQVMFIREMERLGSLPATRCISPTTTSRVLEMAQTSQSHKDVLDELVRERRSQDEASLWSCLRLDWVRHWEPSAQTTILLSRLRDTGSSCDAAVLWYYLTSLHDRQRLVRWIEKAEASGAPQWPELTPEMVNNNTACSSYLKELILHLLARGGLFTQAEMADFELLLWRLGQAGGIMATSAPVPQYRSPSSLDFHSQVVTYCLDNSLQYLLYTYLEHYRLTPRNCPILSSETLYESQPWFEMLVKVQEITRDLSDPRRVFETSLTSAGVLLPGGQASVSSLLLEGHSLLALATIMFAPGGIDQVMSQGEKVGISACRVDPQVLKMALAQYPKLRSALFPTASGRGNSLSHDVSIYHLMQSLHPLDPSRLFGWQSSNTLRFTESSELPHFSSPHLVNKYALIENLDSLYYLRHGRPSFAYATFLIQHLDGSTDVKLLLNQAAQKAYSLAMLHFNLSSVTTACVCFCELLGVCSLQLRVDLRALGLILQHWNQTQFSQTGPEQHVQTLVAKASKLLEVGSGAAEELIGYLEAAVVDSLEQRGIRRSSYEAGHEWAVPVQFCQLHSLTLSSVYPSHCAADGQWIYFLLFVQLHSFPPQQVRSLATQFSPSLRAHLTLAFEDLQVHNQWRNSGPEQQVGAQRDTERILAGYEDREERPRELFQVLLQSQEETSPWRHLLGEALELRCSTLTILATCYQEADLLQCLCVWVLTSIDEVTAGETTAHLDEAPRHHEWNLYDLSIIWKTLLWQGQIRPLLRGFQLFQRDCPLIQMLLMFELCCDYRNYPAAKAKLLDFQKSLITLRSSASVAPGGLPLQWVECQASVLLLTIVQRCSSQYDLHKLLQLFAEVERLLKSNSPDFKHLSQLSELLQGTSVPMSPRLLQSCSPDVVQVEYQDMVSQLQAGGLFTQAKQVAELAGLPIDSLLISQLHQDVKTQKAKRQWSRMETRVSFWKKCHDQFKTHSTDPESASQFFLSQAEATGDLTELLSIQERCLLLCMAGHWLSLLHRLPVARLEALEKQLWASRLRQQVFLFAMEKESVFNLPPTAVTPQLNSYEALMKEFSFSNISALNQDKHLSVDGLPGPAEEQRQDSELGAEDQSFLASLVDQLLDESGIYEASRVCRYFSLFHRDMCLVLHCRALACGELEPQPQELTSEATPRASFASSPSLSSLSSFVMVPLPEDQVVCQLQSLVNECRHGNNYCKQVLSLYQLSKELQCSFEEISKEDPQVVLGKLLLSSQPERFKKAQAFIRAQGLTSESVAQLVSSAVAQGLLATTQESEPAERQVYKPSDGREIFLQLVRLCDDPNLVGVKLLEHLSTVPLRDLESTVEVLILAHDCFSVTCNMEGIVRVLQAARHLSHAHLAPSEHYGLLVRLLTGIGRYNEMTYIFDLLHQNHRFEILLRKKMDADRGQSSSLKTALLDYIKRCLPGDSEKHNMVALCFSMRREIGENHEMAARTQLKIIESQPWVVTSELKSALQKVLALLRDAAESYSKDSCVRQAASCVRMAKLVLLQLHLLNHDSDQRVVNLQPSELLSTIVTLPRCYQVFVVSEAYNYSPDWAEVLYQKVILNGDFVYLEELKRQRPLTAGLFEDISKKLSVSKPPGSATQNLKRLLAHCEDIYTQYRLAYHHQLHDLANMLLQDAKTSSYLNDKLGS